MSERTRLTSSFRDPSGFLFQDQGELFRQINQSYASHYDQLMKSGLYDALADDGLLIPHEEVSKVRKPSEGGYKVIRPEPLDFISYPYEWSFSQLKDAALTTFQIQRRALEFGMSLKDSSAYNIQFYRGRPLLIDTLSFEPLIEGRPWVAYRQYCQHFLAPLALMALRDIRLGLLLRSYIDGVPLDLASRLLPRRTKLNFSLLSHIHLHASAQKRYADTSIKTKSVEGRTMGRYGLQGIIDNLESATRKLEWRPSETEWGEYYSFHGYDESAFDEKKALVGEFLESLQPNSVWDLGANVGLFSRIASERGIPTIAFDIDPAAVELNYRQCVEQSETTLLPLVIDLTNPSPSLGWANAERSSLIERGPADVVFALALIHHLAISNNVPLGNLATFFSKIARWTIFEFVPKEDPQVQRLLISREDIFHDYSLEGFEKAFADCFHIHRKEQIGDSTRTLYLLENRGN
jgi:hypothetical protein